MTAPARPSLPWRTAQLFAAQARVYCLSALIAGALGIAALTAISVSMVSSTGNGPFDAVAIWRSMSGFRQLMTILCMILGLWTPILLAARGVCRITTIQLRGEPVFLSNILNDMARFIPASLLYALVIGFPMMIGASILILPGIVATSIFALVVPTSTNEQLGIFAALRRGVSLGMRVFGKSLLLTLGSCTVLIILILCRIALVDRLIPSTHAYLFAVRFGLTYIPALLVLILANISFTLLYQEACAMAASALPPAAGGPEGHVRSRL